MKLKDVIFRKMTILYFIIMFFLGCAFFVTVNNYGELKSAIEEELSTNPQILVTTDKQFNKIQGKLTGQEVKKLNGGIFYLKANKELTGNDCKLNVVFSSKTSVGSNYKPANDETVIDDFSCTVVGFVPGSGTEILVSEEKFNSYQSKSYSELVTVKNISDYRKLEKKYGAYTLYFVPSHLYDYNAQVVNLNTYYYSSAVIAVIIILLIVVIFLNIRGYVKNNTKKTKKKKQEGTTKLIAISTLITTVIPLALSFVLVGGFIINIIYGL